MKAIAAGLVLLLVLGGCSTAALAPGKMPSPFDFKDFDPRTQFHVRDTGSGSAYLVVRYSTYTYTNVPVDLRLAELKFLNVAKKVASEKGFAAASFEDEGFDISTGYSGITGVSSIVLGNEVSFTGQK